MKYILTLFLITILFSCGYDCPEHDKYMAELKRRGPEARDSLEKAYIRKACPGMEGEKLISKLHSNSERYGIRLEDILICAQLRAEQKRQEYMDDYDAHVSKEDLDELECPNSIREI